MRVLQVSHNYRVVGGSDTVFFETSKILERAGHSTVPFCIDHPDNHQTEWSRFFPRAANSAAPSSRDAFGYFYNFDAARKLNQLIDSIDKIDVAHLHIYHGKHTPSILAVLKRRGIPVVQTLHEYKLACPVYTLQRQGQNCESCVAGTALNCLRHRCKDGSFLRSLVMTAEYLSARVLGDVRNVDHFICVSEFQRQVMINAGVPSKKLTTLHNVVDTSESLKATEDGGYLLYFGRIEEMKGLRTLIEAVSTAGQQLVIAGSGAWEHELANQISQMPNIKYVGFQSGDALTRLIRCATAVVVPSAWYENCPMSVLEAKAMGKPVIASRIGGIPELIREGQDGFLFQAGDSRDLGRALKALESADLPKISFATRIDAENRFSSAAYLAALEEIYRTVGSAGMIPGHLPLDRSAIRAKHPSRRLRP